MDISATHAAHQGIQQGFIKLAENTQQITRPPLLPLNEIQAPLPPTASTKSLESLLLENKQVETQIQGLAKVIKTEDSLIGQLFDDWA